MTEIKASDGKLYVSAIFDCCDSAVLGLAMDTNMKAALCEQTLDNAYKAYPMLRGAILHSDRGTQYTSELYRNAINKYGIIQSMNSAGGRCHDNARCESMWARFKEELLYGRYNTTSMTVEQLKTLIWRYFISYWNNRRICNARFCEICGKPTYYFNQKILVPHNEYTKRSSIDDHDSYPFNPDEAAQDKMEIEAERHDYMSDFDEELPFN